MAGRKHVGSSSSHSHPSSSAAPRALPIAVLQDTVETRHRQIQSILVDNQRLAATVVALKQDLAATELDLRRLTAVATEVKAERDAEVRQFYEKSLKLDADARAAVSMSTELEQVRSDVRELAVAREELVAELRSVESDLARVRAEAQAVPVIKADIEAIRHEIQRGRNAIEFEKKTHAHNLEQKRVMDTNMIIMSREVEKLRAELANVGKRARASVVASNPSPGYGATNYDDAEMENGGKSFPPDTYSMHQIQPGVDGHPQFASGATAHHPYDLKHTQVPR